MSNFASIDIGTNTIRLLIVKEDEKNLYAPICSIRKITRLGEGFLNKNYLIEKAIDRTLSALLEFKKIIEKYEVEKIVLVATSVVREAINKDKFIKKVRDKTGFKMRIISGEEEARLSLAGVFHGIGHLFKKALVFDIGGGSTEFISTSENNPNCLISMNMGVVHLTEEFLKSDPINEFEFNYLVETVKNKINKLKEEFDFFEGVKLIGTAGTITTLAAIDQKLSTYDPKKINGYILKIGVVEKILERLKSKTIEERRRIPGLERGREDLIVAGTVIVLEVMRRLAFKEVIVSDYGLREGVIIDLMRNEMGDFVKSSFSLF